MTKLLSHGFVISLLFFISCSKSADGDGDLDIKDDDPIKNEMGFTDFIADTEFPVANLSQNNVQIAINKAEGAGGGTVILPAGVVNITFPIRLKSNVKLRGTLGTDSTRLTTIFCVEGKLYGSDGAIIIQGKENVTVENLILDVNNCHTQGIAAIYGATNFLISYNLIKNVGTPKVNIVSGERDVPHAEDSPSAINMWNSGEYFTISYNHTMNVAKHGITANMPENDPRGHFLIHDNIMENSFMGMDVSSYSRNVEVYDNEIFNTIFGTKIVSTHDLIYRNNKVYDLDDSPYYWAGIWEYDSGIPLILQNDVDRITIKNNQLAPTEGKPQIAKWGVSESADITMSDNTE